MSACPAPDCTSAIDPTSFACIHHWKALPRSLRDKIRSQQDHEHNLAVQAAKAQRIWSEATT